MKEKERKVMAVMAVMAFFQIAGKNTIEKKSVKCETM